MVWTNAKAKNCEVSSTIHWQAHRSNKLTPTLPSKRCKTKKSSKGKIYAAYVEITLHRIVLLCSRKVRRRENVWKKDHLLRRDSFLEARPWNQRVEWKEHKLDCWLGRRLSRLQNCDRIHVRIRRLRSPSHQHPDHKPRQLPRLFEGLEAEGGQHSACTFLWPVERAQS